MNSLSYYDDWDGTYPLLSMDPDAFRSSANIFESLYLDKFDTSQLDFGFLVKFPKFNSLGLSYIKNFMDSFPVLYSLPALEDLSLGNLIGLNETWQSINETLRGNGLIYFTISSCDLDDFGIAHMIDWILPSSVETLNQLIISDNKLRSVPQKLASFKKLQYMDMSFNRENCVIANESIYMSWFPTIGGSDGSFPDCYLAISSAQVVHVEPGAFQGDY